MTYFKKTKFHLSEGPFFKFCDTKPKKGKNAPKKKNALPKIVFCRSKLHEALSTLKIKDPTL
jgi:hypothetical protein